MIIPSIDLMNGKAVQLRQGRELVLIADQDPVTLAREFNRYGEVAVIDLDAAMGKGDNLELVREICRVADVRAGGGIRTAERGDALLRAGARRIIIGTSAEPEFLSQFPRDRVIVALDHRNGQIVDQGWQRETREDVWQRAERLAPHCGGFLCTFVETEGTLGGMNMEALLDLKNRIDRPLTVAGGVADTGEAAAIIRMGLDVQVGMALYAGCLDLAEAFSQSLDFAKAPLIPTIVQDEAGQVLMLAWSSPESLQMALREGRGVYYSRSRQSLWRKGETSGHEQILLRCRTDCDRDTLIFTVRQTAQACHTGSYSCFQTGREGQEFSLPLLFETLKERKNNPTAESYSSRLFANRELLLRKLMEEAFEITRAPDRRNLTWEIADLLYFASALAVDEGIDWSDIEAELGGRSR